MDYGFLKVGAASPELKVADCDFNIIQIKKVIEKADAEKVKLLVFPEMSICGYTCGDLLFQETLISSVEEAILEIKEFSKKFDMIIIIGAPIKYECKLFASAILILKGKILGVVPKTNIPNYSEFYELRYFQEALKDIKTVKIGENKYPFGTKLLFCCENFNELILAVEICEDLWAVQTPSSSHALAGATLIANLSASDEVIGKKEFRRKLVSCQSAKLICGYIYSDAGEGESTTDMVFASHCIIAEEGRILKENKLFESDLIISEIDLKKLSSERQKNTTFKINDDGYEKISFKLKKEETKLTRKINKSPFVPADSEKKSERCDEILLFQAKGLAKRLKHTSSNCIIGISGGLDSTLALLVAVKATDMIEKNRNSVIAVTMPCFGTTDRTLTNAEILCESLNVDLKRINITESVLKHFDDINHDKANLNIVYENSQARERTQVLMDIANQNNALVIGTGDLSELALGWATYNGDHMSMYGVNSSVPKTLVRHIVENQAEKTKDKKLKSVLYDILSTPVSPELLPSINGEISQKTENIVGPYELHDFFLYYFCRFGFSPKKIFYLASYAFKNEYEKAEILKWLKIFVRRFFNQQFKRSCLPDGPKIGSVTLSPRGDLRMPSDACSTIWLNQLDEIII